jgi:hypothetical protein
MYVYLFGLEIEDVCPRFCTPSLHRFSSFHSLTLQRAISSVLCAGLRILHFSTHPFPLLMVQLTHTTQLLYQCYLTTPLGGLYTGTGVVKSSHGIRIFYFKSELLEHYNVLE